MEDVVFLYDQAIEHIVRLHAFRSTKRGDLAGDGDVHDDVDHVADLLAKRDLLTFAERARFAEIHLELQATIKQPKPLDSHDETSRLALGNALEVVRQSVESHARRGHGASALRSRSRTVHSVSATLGRDDAVL